MLEAEDEGTAAVVGGMHLTRNARTRELVSLLGKPLHAFVREAKLTEREFQDAVGAINAIGRQTTPSHNEAMLLAGALGVSNLICLMNNGARGTRPTQANNLGPFYRANAPRFADGDSILRSPTPGAALLFRGRVVNMDGKPIAGADVHVWQS